MTGDSLQPLLDQLRGHRLVIASSSEPFVHYYHGGVIRWRGAAGGVATAFDSLLQACGGTWIALGLGSADKDAVDKNQKIRVPPPAPRYDLARVFITPKEEKGFLAESSNSALWPLSHVSFVRPRFSEDAWKQFQSVNQKMAERIHAESDEHTLVWINDYHLSLTAGPLKKLRPGLRTGFFWHIPWPAPETFTICPWKNEILDGILSNDFVGFHINAYVDNFLRSVQNELSCEIDWKTKTVKHNGRTCRVGALPIGIDAQTISALAAKTTPQQIETVRSSFHAKDRVLLLGVDRLDYTKGLAEKIRALDHLFTRRPDLVNRLILVQIVAPSRIHLPEYIKAIADAKQAADEVNWKYAANDWQPVILKNDFVPLSDIIPLYKAADACLVTSLQDGMNLVSKEFVASNEGTGVLVLSRFAGSAEELQDAVFVNPFVSEDIARGIETAIEMKPAEKKNRWAAMKQTVDQNDVFAWAGRFIHAMHEEPA